MNSTVPSLFVSPSIVPRLLRKSTQNATFQRKASIPLCCVNRSTIESFSATSSFDLAQFSTILSDAQSNMCRVIENIDQKAKFCDHPWASQTGNGRTRVLQNGNVFEKAGVNVSLVHGKLSETRAAAMNSRGRKCIPGSEYYAAALSFVLHAQSPFVPTLRGDVRVFMCDNNFWGGGGVDLTIFYINRDQIRQFHQHWKQVCDDFDPTWYSNFKKQCDEYFYIPSRLEYRGVGGLFYDDLALTSPELLKFQSRMLTEFLPSYIPIVNSNKSKPWSEDQKRWQRIRRGRYLEFNLIADRGVRFGLDRADDSRTEAIMISAPPSVEWPYAYYPDKKSAEEETLLLLRGSPVNWISES